MNREGNREEKTNDRRAAILRAALEVFGRNGYAAATVAEIRRLSGASTGSIYHHFGDKEGIAAALYLECLADYQAGFAAVLRADPPAEEGIRGLVGYHLKWVERNPDRARFLHQMRHAPFMAGAEEDVGRLNREFAGAVMGWTARQVEAGALRPLPRDLFIAVLLGPCQEYVRQRLAGLKTVSPAQAARELATVAWRSLAGSKSGAGTREGKR
jgi:AcrR family transcriptional regulator